MLPARLEHPGDPVPRRRASVGEVVGLHGPRGNATDEGHCSWCASCGPLRGAGARPDSAAHRPSTTARGPRRRSTSSRGAGAFFSSPAGQLVLKGRRCRCRPRARPRRRRPRSRGGGVAGAVAVAAGLHAAPDLAEAEDLLACTLAYWQHWLRDVALRGRYREMVERLALALKLLVHQPTGALVPPRPRRCPSRWAAPQLGLPLHLGPGRGLHRLRADAAGILRGGGRLHGLAGGALHRGPGRGPGCSILYCLDGGPVPAEESLDHLRGLHATPGRCGSATAPLTSCSWTSTAS